MTARSARIRKCIPSAAATLVLLLAALSLRAAVLRNYPVAVTQPNGEKLALLTSGDEYYNWLHDKSGYTIIQDPDNGCYVYAREENGRLVSSGMIVTANDAVNQAGVLALGLPPGAQVAPELRPKPADLFPQGSPANPQDILQVPHAGTMNNLVIFIRFTGEAEFTDLISVYDDMFNPTTPGANSMRNYFAEVSYNTLTMPTSFYPTPTTTVVSYQDSHDRNYFKPYDATTNPTGYSGTTERTTREHTLLKDAVNAVSSQVPAGLNIDGDGDGYVDNVCFIIDGEPTAWSTLLWPHMWSLYSYNVSLNGKRVYTYNFQLQNHMKSSGVGVLCHEMFHSLGAPDLYHYSSTYSYLQPAYKWDLMEWDLNPPQHMTAYMKWKYGKWIASIPEISAAGTYSLNPLTSATNNCYKIASPLSATEYFVVEYRKKTTTFENGLPGEGLLVMRINTACTGNANGPPDEVYIYRPGGTTTADGTPASAHFSSAVGRTAINDSTNPSSFLTAGGAGGLSISGVGAAGSTISFTVDFPYGVTRALTVRATNSGTAVTVSPNDSLGNGNGATDFSRTYVDGQTVSLTAPATSGALSFQKWYLDGAVHAATPATTVTMNAAHEALAVYGVDLGEAVDNTALAWVPEGKGWFGQTTTSYSGGDAAQSADITDDEQTFVSTTVTGPGTVSWYWKVSSEYAYDYSYFYIDESIEYYTSGNMNWTLVSVPVPAGVHTLRWSYEKDENTSTGSDCAWIDLVTYAGPAGRDWRILSGVNPEAALRLDFDGTGGDELAGDFGSTGLWLYGGGTWLQLSGVNPDGVVAADVDGNGSQEIVGDFGTTGLWLDNGGSWQILSGVNPDAVIAADLDGNGTREIVGDFGTLGLWKWAAGAWSQISGVNPEALLAANTDGGGGQEVVADFGATGLYQYKNSAWQALSGDNVELMIKGDFNADGVEELYLDLGAGGLFRYNNGSVSQLSAANTEAMIAADTDGAAGDELVADFGAGGLSLWKSGAWTLLSSSNASGLAGAEIDGDGLVQVAANFPSLGVFRWKSGTGWTQMTGTQAEALGAADTDGDGLEELVADFGAIGLWLW